jgi:hypothetical protein
MNAYQQKMNMKRESICNKGIWTAKKRYMLNVYMGEDDVLLEVSVCCLFLSSRN